MTGAGWRLLNFVSRVLGREEREAVQGDLAEAGISGWQALLEVLGLVVRREAALWGNWRPWLAAFGLALPGSFCLMGLSVSASRAYQHLYETANAGLWPLVGDVCLLAGWSWTGGVAVGRLSRRTVWVSALLSFAPCLFCLARFRIESLPRLCLLLFLPPAIWGLRLGIRMPRMRRSSSEERNGQ